VINHKKKKREADKDVHFVWDPDLWGVRKMDPKIFFNNIQSHIEKEVKCRVDLPKKGVQRMRIGENIMGAGKRTARKKDLDPHRETLGGM